MFRGSLVLVLLLALAYAQGTPKGAAKQDAEQKQLQRIRDLKRELRELPSMSPGGIVRPSDQKRIFAEIAKVNHPEAVRALAALADEPEHVAVREDLLQILVQIPKADEAVVSRVMRAHIGLSDPARRVARKYLLDQAVLRRKDDFPHDLFCIGTIEDKFLALQAMGRIGSDNVLECAMALLKDTRWTPDATGLISCGTIALSVGGSEGPGAAWLLMLLQKDPRFTAADAVTVREATHTWRQTDLRAYVVLANLSDRDPAKRQETAALLGAVGIEAARAPLVRVAFNRSEVPEVRAAAATALGGLRIARDDLAEQLQPLLSEPDPIVRAGAMAGLGRLNVRRAAEALVSMLDGPFAAEVRAALWRLTNMPADTDWRKWLRTAFPGPSTAPPFVSPGSPPPAPRGGK